MIDPVLFGKESRLMENRPHHDRARRVVLAGFLIAVLCSYIGALYYTQIVKGASYLEQSVRTITRQETVEASRGVITDRSGRTLVSNRSSYNLTFDSSLLKDGDDENQAILRLIQLCQKYEVPWADNLLVTQSEPFSFTVDSASSTQKNRFCKYLQSLSLLSADVTSDTISNQALSAAGLTPDKLLSAMRTAYGLPSDFSAAQARLVLGVQYELAVRKLVNTTAYVFAEDVNTDLISIITDGRYAGVRITTSSVREYDTTSAAHILGVVTSIGPEQYSELKSQGYNMDDKIGQSGVELAFEKYLKGTDGRRIVSTNSDGKITSELYSVEPKPGGTVGLTIDLNLQQAAEAALTETVQKMDAEDGNTTRGAGVAVIKVGTGEVLALASYPTFNLSSYSADYTSLSENPANPLLNRATQGTYAPGSTLKPMTAVAALQEGKVTTTEKIDDTGCWYYPGAATGDHAYCWKRSGHGWLNITQAITNSCNYFFAEMGYRLGLDDLNKYASNFGLGAHTGIEIGDAAGSLAQEEAGQDLAPWAAFGQANYLFTPLQLANYIATLVDGGKHYDAHLLKSVKSYDNSSVVYAESNKPSSTFEISDSTLHAVKEGMHGLTTSGGPLASYFASCVVDAGAKTGTAQINKNIKNNGVFVCFAPYDDPQIALAMVIEKGGTGAALASTAVKILNAYFTTDQIGTAVITGENQLLN